MSSGKRVSNRFGPRQQAGCRKQNKMPDDFRTEKGTPFCQIRVGKRKIQALVDTGADMSVISESFFKLLNKKSVKHSSSCDLPLLIGVSGRPLGVKKKVVLTVSMGQETFNSSFVVVENLRKNMIIGCDLLREQKVFLDFEQSTLRIRGSVVLLKSKDTCSSFLVSAKAKTRIPPHSVMNIEIRLKRHKQQSPLLITPLDNCRLFASQSGVMMANTIVDAKHTAVVSIVNETGCTFVVQKNEVVGLATPQKEIHQVEQVQGKNPNYTAQESSDILRILKLDHIEPGSRYRLLSLLREFKELFVEKDEELGRTKVTKAHLDTGGTSPIKQNPYRVPLIQRKVIEDQVETMLKASVISPSHSPWSSPVVIVPKKDGTKRFCVDYRKLNRSLKQNAYPLPHIQDSISSLGGAKYFSCLDLKSGFWQIEMDEESRQKTAFTCFMGLYEFNVLPFGLSVAPSVFQNLMNEVLAGTINKHTLVYIDDIIVFSKTLEEHLQHLRDVFGRLQKAGLRLKPSKCEFLKESIKYLGHEITPSGIKPDTEKIQVIQNMFPPKNVRGVRSFLGMLSFYRQFIHDFAEVAKPLTSLTRKNAHFQWGSQEQAAFDTLKQKLLSSPILAYPDPDKPYNLYTDASKTAVGAVLTQDTEGEGERAIQFISHQLSEGQQKWPCIEREAYAIVYSVLKLRHLLVGTKFTIFTDHKPLRSLFTAEMKNPRVQRWSIILDEFDCDIQYISAAKNAHADHLSRMQTNLPDEPDEIDIEINVVNTDDKRFRNPEPMQQGTEDEVEKERTEDLVNLDTVQEAQQRDPELVELIEKINTDPDDRAVKNFVMYGEVLYHISEPCSLDRKPRLQVVIPSALTEQVLRCAHDSSFAGHVGIDKTYDKLRTRYFWKNMYKDTVRYIGKCIKCRPRKLTKQKVPVQEMPTAEYPFQIIGIDTCGPYPDSFQGNRHIITVVDHFSGWPEAFAVKDKSANTVAKVLLEEVIPRHACPSLIISDRGTEFNNALVEQLTSQLNIKHNLTSAYHPQSNGKTERFHRFLNASIAKSIETNQREWDQHLPGVLSSYRVSVHDSTKFSPFFLMYGRDPVLPMDTLLEPKMRYMGEEYVPTMLQRLNEAYAEARDNTAQVRQKNRRLRNKDTKLPEFHVGDPVYYFRPALKKGVSSKFTTGWQPYYRVVEQTSPVNFRIRCQVTGDTRIVHAENLRMADPDSAWDKERNNPQPILNKYRRGRRRAAATRVQPQRQCKHTGHRKPVSESSLSSENSGSDSDVHNRNRETVPIPVFAKGRSTARMRSSHLSSGSNDSDEDIPLSVLKSRDTEAKRKRHFSSSDENTERKRVKETRESQKRALSSPSDNMTKENKKLKARCSDSFGSSLDLNTVSDLLKSLPVWLTSDPLWSV